MTLLHLTLLPGHDYHMALGAEAAYIVSVQYSTYKYISFTSIGA